MTISVYVDDIALSSNNKQRIERAYKKLRRTIAKSNFLINEEKSLEPALNIAVFNCHLTRKETLVTEERQQEFYSVDRSPLSEISFEKYCDSVALGNG
jgi:GR25 family glycosyltransferase involved in LPS biosynthesis